MLMACPIDESSEVEDEGSLLLREFSHRAMNELAVARSAVAIARRALARDDPSSMDMLAGVELRLASSGSLLRMLARPVQARVDLGVELTALSRAILDGRHEAAGSFVSLEMPEVWVDGILARRVALIAAEFISNACRHALAGRAGHLGVHLKCLGSDLVLEVVDDGPSRPNAGAVSGTGFGGGIVAGLARTIGASVTLELTAVGAVARLYVPDALVVRGRRGG